MSYHRRRRALAGDTTHGPSWYRAMGGVSTQLPSAPVRRGLPALGSLGDDTLSTPTITDPTLKWQADVQQLLRDGVEEMRRGDRYKLLQIAATLMIPLSAAIWRVIFRRGSDPTV